MQETVENIVIRAEGQRVCNTQEVFSAVNMFKIEVCSVRQETCTHHYCTLKVLLSYLCCEIMAGCQEWQNHLEGINK